MGQRLLLVDSDRSFLKEHQVSLEAAFDLEVTHSPEGVVSRLETGDFAAVVICVEVAENKGYALCSTIRRQANLSDVRIVLISAKASDEEYRRHQSLKGRADLYLHKPITPSTFVAALAPVVPGRTTDPDNPFGELVDTELGDDWLDSLKTSVEAPVSAPEPRPDSPVQTVHLEAMAAAPQDAARTRLLEEQVAALQEELHAKDLRLQASEDALQRIQRQLNSVTLNLDEQERSQREAETLRVRLAETESALQSLEASKGLEGEDIDSLKAQLREALEERAGLIQQVETLNTQVGEKAQRAIELLKERDRLMHETLDLQPFRKRAQELEMLHAESLVAHEAALADLEQGRTALLDAHADALAEMQREQEGLLASHASALGVKQHALDAAEEAQQALNDSLESLVGKYETLEGVHQAALLDIEGYKEKLHAATLEVGGLEATLRGQGRDLAELGGKLGTAEAELEACRTQIKEQEKQIQMRQELVQQHQEEIVRLSGQLAALRQELDEAKLQHEGERLELMHGLDEKYAELQQLNLVVTTGQEAYALLEREKQSALGQLSEHRDRLQNLDGLLQEIQDKLRRGSDLARG